MPQTSPTQTSVANAVVRLERQLRPPLGASRPAGDALEGERKTVTALFADIKGSMELIEDLDPEDGRGPGYGGYGSAFRPAWASTRARWW